MSTAGIPEDLQMVLRQAVLCGGLGVLHDLPEEVGWDAADDGDDGSRDGVGDDVDDEEPDGPAHVASVVEAQVEEEEGCLDEENANAVDDAGAEDGLRARVLVCHCRRI